LVLAIDYSITAVLDKHKLILLIHLYYYSYCDPCKYYSYSSVTGDLLKLSNHCCQAYSRILSQPNLTACLYYRFSLKYSHLLFSFPCNVKTKVDSFSASNRPYRGGCQGLQTLLAWMKTTLTFNDSVDNCNSGRQLRTGVFCRKSRQLCFLGHGASWRRRKWR